MILNGCPFCGGAAHLTHRWAKETFVQMAVECRSCGGMMLNVTDDQSTDTTASMWNNRVQPGVSNEDR